MGDDNLDLDFDPINYWQHRASNAELNRLRQQNAETNQLLKQLVQRQQLEDAKPECPRCRGKINANASLCIHCRSDLVWLPIPGGLGPFDGSTYETNYVQMISAGMQEAARFYAKAKADLAFYREVVGRTGQGRASDREGLEMLEYTVNALTKMVKSAQEHGLSLGPHLEEQLEGYAVGLRDLKASFAQCYREQREKSQEQQQFKRLMFFGMAFAVALLVVCILGIRSCSGSPGVQVRQQVVSSGYQYVQPNNNEQVEREELRRMDEQRVAAEQLRIDQEKQAKQKREQAALEQRRKQDQLAAEKKRMIESAPIMNSIEMPLKLLPPGTFTRGPDADALGARPTAVTLTRAFYIGVTEVTQDQYERIMGNNPSAQKGPSHPVESVTWDEAVEFCRRLSNLQSERLAGRVYRLPTEAEWEYVCRAGSTTDYSFGDYALKLQDYGWYEGNSENKTHPVGEKAPNPWRLFDMHGNVGEWCQDRHASYLARAETDPTGPSAGNLFVYRGGSWSDDAERCRSAQRNKAISSDRLPNVGFRVALTAPMTQ